MKTETSIEQLILDTLRDGPQNTETLITLINKARKGTTRQGIYRALRVLKTREVITIHNKTISLSAIWISQMQNYFALAAHYYSRPSNDSSFLTLREGQKITYSFRTLLELDVFWSHALYLFFEVVQNNHPIYIYNPHDWAYFARKESDEVLVKKLLTMKRQLFIAVGISSAIGKLVQRNFDGTQGQYYIVKSELGLKRNYYVNVINDYCIEGFLDNTTVEQLDSFYKTNTTMADQTMIDLQNIITKKGRHKLVISRNKKRAESIKKMFSKYFYIKK